MVKIGVADKSLPIGNKLAKPGSFAGSKSLCQPPKLISKKKKIMFGAVEMLFCLGVTDRQWHW